jgi:hypothetical protein
LLVEFLKLARRELHVRFLAFFTSFRGGGAAREPGPVNTDAKSR